jgi:exodeoxyribonuclease V alpha subunit
VTEEISGLIERVTFHNEENGFCVLRVKTRGTSELTGLVGRRAKGDWKWVALVLNWLLYA